MIVCIEVRLMGFGRSILPERNQRISQFRSRILSHAPKRGDVLHWNNVTLDACDVAGPLEQMQAALFAHSTDFNES